MVEIITDRKTPPSTQPISSITVPQAREFRLDNGIPVYAISAGFQQLVKVEFLFFNKAFDPAKPILHSATNRLLSEGTKSYTAQQLADAIDFYGAFYETDENADFCSVNLFTLSRYLDQTLPLIHELLTNPIFPEKELGVYKQNQKQHLVVENEKVSSLARRKFNELIFGGSHPYGRFVLPADYDNLNRDDIAAHFAKKYDPSNCTIIVSGLVTDETINRINAVFGMMRSSPNGAQNAAYQFDSNGQNKVVIEKDGAVQSAIRIGKQFFNRTHPDYPGMSVVNTVLGGYFGSRLMSNIREEKGYTYGIGSAIVSMRQEGYFFIATETGTEVTAAAIEEIYKETELLRNEFVETEELEMVRNYMLGVFLKSIDGAFQIAERFKSIYLSGLDYSYYDRYLDKIRTITPDEIKALAHTYFDTTGFVELVVGRK